MTGSVRTYGCRSGYGFIESDGKDFFFSHKEWEYRIPPVPGLKVSFVPVTTDKGFRATKIRREK